MIVGKIANPVVSIKATERMASESATAANAKKLASTRQCVRLARMRESIRLSRLSRCWLDQSAPESDDLGDSHEMLLRGVQSGTRAIAVVKRVWPSSGSRPCHDGRRWSSCDEFADSCFAQAAFNRIHNRTLIGHRQSLRNVSLFISRNAQGLDLEQFSVSERIRRAASDPLRAAA